MDETTQLDLFRRAVAAIGGPDITAHALDMDAAAVAALLAGDQALRAGMLEAMSRALIDHATGCRALERQLSPAFAENRTPAQISPR